MGRCEECGADLPEGAGSCPACGEPLDPGRTIEIRGGTRADSISDSRPGSGAPGAPSPPRFAPGQMLGDRYRLVALLGRGGMGEVYRAEDLRLGESVALKFLPPALAGDPAWRQRLKDEVRVTRQVTHPNVCRVHDLVETDGETFISMEYIDGEDLATLLRRIGRLPEDKAIEIARQVCGGLAAAHARGVLHRDLKPANAMLDGRGRVKLTDFGIAALAEAAEGEFAGTPLYMAPEVVRGEPATARSDIYSLGLLLYELLTGRRAIDADSMAAVHRWHDDERSRLLASGAGIPPAIGEAIERCLSPAPEDRPSSVLSVAAILPGGDPLLEALAAGETPSPEAVAAAGGAGTISRWSAVLLAFAVVGGVAIVAFLDREIRLPEIAPMVLTPDVLEYRAKEILRELGYETPPADSARGLRARPGLVPFIERADVGATRWECLREPSIGAIQFWYRQSDTRLVPRSRPGGRVWEDDPPQDAPGMAMVVLTAAGDLVHLSVVPSREVAPAGVTGNFAAALRRCGFDMSALAPAEVAEYPPVPFDDIRAFAGPHPTVEGVRSLIEIAMWRGRPVHVQVREADWSFAAARPAGARAPGPILGDRDGHVRLLTFLVPLFAGAWFGIANLRAGRGDRAGAFRVGMVFVILFASVWLVRAHHVGSLADERVLLVRMLQETLFLAVFAWFLYLAIEPTIRRHWPQKLVSWTRLLRGNPGDALVARDTLVGLVCGVGIALVARLHWHVAAAVAPAPPPPTGMDFAILDSPRQAIGQLLFLVGDAAFTSIVALFLLVLALLITRRRAAAYLIIALLGVVRLPYEVRSELPELDFGFRVVAVLVLLIAVDRSLLGIIGAIFAFSLLGDTVITLDAGAWHLPQGVLASLVLCGGAVALAFVACRGAPARPRGRVAWDRPPTV